MARHIQTIIRKFESSSASSYARADAIRSLKKISSWEKRYLCESLINESWQDWCLFCRDILLSSCRGVKSTTGVIYRTRNEDNSWQRIGYEAKNLHKKAGVLSYMRHEPTWGDVDKISDVINTLVPTNSAELLSAFGAGTLASSVKQMQILRNCLAHKNFESVDSLKKNYVYYTVPSYPIEPYELMWCPYQKSPIAFYAWLSDMKKIAELCDQ